MRYNLALIPFHFEECNCLNHAKDSSSLCVCNTQDQEHRLKEIKLHKESDHNMKGIDVDKVDNTQSEALRVSVGQKLVQSKTKF